MTVSVLSLLKDEHREYARKHLQSICVFIDKKWFMLNPRQLVPKKAIILTRTTSRSENIFLTSSLTLPVGIRYPN